jgi:hypothetical protein
VIEKVPAERPLGFCCRGSQSIHTRELLAELGFLYDSNGFDASIWRATGWHPSVRT